MVYESAGGKGYTVPYGKGGGESKKCKLLEQGCHTGRGWASIGGVIHGVACEETAWVVFGFSSGTVYGVTRKIRKLLWRGDCTVLVGGMGLAGNVNRDFIC